MTTSCGITVHRLPNGRYRASTTLFPDCEATAATEEEARRAVETSIMHLLKQQMGEHDEDQPPKPPIRVQ